MNTVAPFRIAGPAIVSFSGGRTSAYMLWRILAAHGGKLPPDVHVAFANTGREMEGTLRFVLDCGEHWGVPITWLEYRWAPGRAWAEEVAYNTASRAGEPFASFTEARPALPNPVQRSCTAELKIRTIKRWAVSTLGWKNWTNIIGLRADEPRRLARLAAPSKERFTRNAPLAASGTTKEHVALFWESQPFDLGLAGPHEGNCDGCFLKSRASLLRMCQDHPERMAWWAAQEAVPRGTAGVNRRFRSSKSRVSYQELLDEARDMPATRQAALASIVVDESTEPCADEECVI